MQRQIERAHQRYIGTLLAVGLPRKLSSIGAKNKDAPLEIGEPKFDWYCNGWRAQIAQFYLDAHEGSPPPSTKTQKKFLRGFVAWCRKEVQARFHGVTGRRRK
jgi:hypothetical protein